MDWLIYLILGLVQGITEWLPISSSGHLVIIEELFNVKEPGLAFEVLLNFASLLAMIIIFWQDLWKLIVGFFTYLFKKDPASKADFKFGLYLIIATIPAGVLGLLFADMIETTLSNFLTVSLMLLVTGLLLLLISKVEGKKPEVTLNNAIVIGLFQAIALIPGISRSGATLVAGLFQGIDKRVAIRFSFFLAIPVSVGTMILKTGEVIDQIKAGGMLEYLLAFVVTFISAIFAIRWFMGILEKGKLIYFTYYCWIVGSGLLIYYFIAM